MNKFVSVLGRGSTGSQETMVAGIGEVTEGETTFGKEPLASNEMKIEMKILESLGNPTVCFGWEGFGA